MIFNGNGNGRMESSTYLYDNIILYDIKTVHMIILL